MKKLGLCTLLVSLCFVTIAGNAFGEAGATSRNYTIDYSFTPSGASEAFTGYQTAANEDDLSVELPPTGDMLYTLYAQGSTLQSDYRSEVGSYVALSELGAVDVDHYEVRSVVENTQRFYLSDDDGDGEDDITIAIDTFLYGTLGLYNPYFSANPLNIAFGPEGNIEIGYSLSVTAASDAGFFWNTMAGTGGLWSHEFMSSGDSLTFNTSGMINDEITMDDLTNNEFVMPMKNSDVGKPFDVTISLETWIVGQNFTVTGDSTDLLAMSSNLHYDSPNNLCYMELTAGGSPTALVPEPSAAALLLCCLIAGTLLKLRKRTR